MSEDTQVPAAPARLDGPSLREQLRARLKQRKGAAEPAAPRIARVAEAARVLSFSQQRLWLLDQLMGANAVYNISFAIRLQGQLDVAVLRRCLQLITSRHEALRTRFVVDGGEARIVVDAAVPLELPVEPAATLEEVLAVWRKERHHLFRIGEEALFRARLLQESPDAHVLVVTMHHIVSDAWSLGVFFSELVRLYGDLVAGRPASLQELAIQYADYAAWQRQWLSGEVLAEHTRYWQRQLAGAPPLLSLPTDRPRPVEQTFRGATEPVHIPVELTAALQQLGQAHGATLFMGLLSAFAFLLGRYAGQQDVVVGAPIANRMRREAEDLIGFFVNTLALRTRLAGDPSFLDLLGRVRETALDAYAHQDLPFETLVEALNPERSLSHSPLFQVMFILQNAPLDRVSLPGVTVSPLDGGQMGGFARFDLTLSLAEGKQGLEGVLEYNSDLFDRGTITRLADHYVRLLRAVVAKPHVRMASLVFIGEREKQQQRDWTETRVARPPLSLHAAVLAQALRTPQALAVLDGDVRLRYGELSHQAARLAARLQSDGVRRGDRVGVCMDRSAELVVALLGVLQAGATYVAVDPGYPAQRLAYVMEHARLTRMLSRRQDHARLGALPGSASWWYVDEMAGTDAPPAQVFSVSAGPADAAYVIYTSGSTGVPKGVVGLHGSVMNRLHWMAERHPVAAGEVFCQKTSVSFVDHVAEIFQALTAGVPLLVVQQAQLQSPPELLQVLRQHAVTRLTLVPSLLLALLREPGLEPCPAMRLIVTSGEALVLQDPAAFQRVFPQAQLLNLYGSTEIGADVTAHEVSVREAGAAPIGRPISNTQAYILAGDMALLPQGAVGELFVGGAGLAQGYLQQPGLTAGRFLPDPHSGTPGARLFRTGDLARWRADGVIEYLGRADHQVKIRGFRIELGEVDVALRAHPAVQGAVTTVWRTPAGDDQLVAYVVPAQGTAAQGSLATPLQDYLRARLPPYMVPTVIQALERFPITSTGKIDRQALPAPELSAPLQDEPVGEYEALLAELWRDVLKCPQPGRHANFFEQGGHSLLVTQLRARIRNAFGVELPFMALFEQQTLLGQAQLIVAAKSDGAAAGAAPLPPAIVPLAAAARAQPQPLSTAQQRLWFLDRLMGPSPAYNISLALWLLGPWDVERLAASLQQLVQRHGSLRTGLQELPDGSAAQFVRPHGQPVQVDLVDGEAEVLRLAQHERMQSFDLCHDALVRIRLVRNTRGDGQALALLVTFHHIVSDGWSLGVFFQEMVALYRAATQQGAPALPEPALQFVDFAVWQRAWLSGGVLDRQLAYWRHQLADLPTLLELPTDRPRPPEQSLRGAGIAFTLRPGLLDGLKALCRRQGVTLFMALLSVYALLLRRHAGQTDIAIGTPIANRGLRELEALIGFFANTLVMRVDLSGNPSFTELLGRTRQMALDAYANQDVPFERLVEELSPARSMGHSPLFQVMFVLQNAPMEVQRLEGLSAAPLQTGDEDGMARFDLHLAMGEHRGQLAGRLDYNRDLFDRARMQRLVAHFGQLLEALLQAPEQPVGSCDFLTAEERQHQLLALNDTAREYPRQATLKSLFESQVARTPQAPALSFEGRTLSYAELNARANRLAHHLIAGGVRRDECVGLCAQRSLEMVVGIYGILKAGCAYLPLDPEYPPERLRHIVAEAQVRRVVSHQGLAAALAGDVGEVIDLDQAGELLAGYGEHNPALPDLGSDHLAYVLYTSGSTGRPKGVMIEHRAVVNRILWMQDEYRLHAADVVLQKTPYSFDVSVWEFVWPLIVGARLVLAAPGGHKDPEYLTTLIRQEGVSTLHFVPSMLQGQLTLGQWKRCDSVRLVFCSGEALPAAVVQAFFATGTRSELHNLYGPTEAAIDVSYWPCSPADVASVPIGRPIQNIQLHIVDEQLQLLPEGSPGELLIAGDGLARGYIQRPDLTRERFLPNPFSAEPGSRVYRTGDLVRRLPSGAIEYLGRLDNQVKINGLRIELGEIESRLLALDSVANAAVIAHTDGQLPTRLVAYVVPAGTAPELPVAQIRQALAASLPAFMVPQVYIALDEIPLNANGKLDRKRLPKVGAEHLDAAPYVGPADELERTLVQVWQRNLGLQRVGVGDNYFGLGGDSIRSIELVVQARAAGVQFQVKDLFMHPTIAGLAQAIRGGQAHTAAAPAPTTEAFGLLTDEEREALLAQYS